MISWMGKLDNEAVVRRVNERKVSEKLQTGEEGSR